MLHNHGQISAKQPKRGDYGHCAAATWSDFSTMTMPSHYQSPSIILRAGSMSFTHVAQSPRRNNCKISTPLCILSDYQSRHAYHKNSSSSALFISHLEYHMQFDKPATTYEEQADILLSRGLAHTAANKNAVREEVISRLQDVGYYRLSGYWYPFVGTSTFMQM